MKFLNWNEYTEIIEKLNKEMTGRHFDGVISIGRGGVIAGGIFAHKLGLPLYPLFIRHSGLHPNVDIIVEDLGGIEDIDEGRMLIVDDLMITGETVKLVKSHLSKNVQTEILAFACWKYAKLKPDYVGIYVDEDIMFPYSIAPSKIPSKDDIN